MQNRKKILYIITKSIWGGAQRYVYDLATNISKDTFDVAVAAGGRGILFEKLARKGVRTICIPHSWRDVQTFNEARVFFELIKICFTEKPDVVHLNSSKMGVLGSCAVCLYNIFRACARAPRASTVFTAHGWGFEEPRPQWQKTIIHAASRFSALLQKKIIVINSSDFSAAKKFIPEKKLILIRNGIMPLPRYEKHEAQKKLFPDLQKNTVIIGAIAELTKNKGLSFLIEAMHIVRQRFPHYALALSIIGEGEERASLDEKIKTLGLALCVRLHGFIPDAQNLVRAFDILALSSVKEGLPYTIMDAMEAGVPVVATEVGGIPDLVLHGKTGLLVQPQKAEELARALSFLLDKKEKREEFAARAQKHIQTNFTFYDMVRKTELVYSSLTCAAIQH